MGILGNLGRRLNHPKSSLPLFGDMWAMSKVFLMGFLGNLGWLLHHPKKQPPSVWRHVGHEQSIFDEISGQLRVPFTPPQKAASLCLETCGP